MRINYKELECYERATKKQLQSLANRQQYFDLELVPSDKMKEEMAAFIRVRGTQINIRSIDDERMYHNQICNFLHTQKRQTDSFLSKTPEQWMNRFKVWRMQNGLSTVEYTTNVYGNKNLRTPKAICYFMKLLQFVQPLDERPEREKDIWELDKLEISIKQELIRNCRTLNFTRISQPMFREEVKKAIYLHLQSKALGTIKGEITSMNAFSKFLKKNFPHIVTSEDLTRNVIEDYIVEQKTERGIPKGSQNNIFRLRTILETIGKLYQYPHLEMMFLNTDIRQRRESEFKAYSDEEVKRLNVGIKKLTVQIARVMFIHQMLGTRISDTLALRRTCLYTIGEQDMITIHQSKTKVFQKPISKELAQFIQKSIEYSMKQFGESEFIFVDENHPNRPLQYQTVSREFISMTRKENMRNDNGKHFGFGSHLYRHRYGVKLTELHVDDWTLAKLLGHRGTESVKYYRRMSNQVMADETRKVRGMMSETIMANLEGWGAEYEQIR